MAKILVNNYTFDKTAKTITFTDYGSIRLDKILLVANVTSNVIIYNFSNPALGGTVATNVLTLTYNTSAMNNTDKLEIFYDDPTITTDFATQTTLAAVKTKTDNIPPLGQALNTASVPVVLTAAQIATLTPLSSVTVSGSVTANAGTNLNTSALALETGGNLATVVTNTNKIPSLGQALAAASVPVVLTAAQITTLTPPAAITNFANETGGHLASLDTKLPAQGQALAAASVPVVLTAAQITTLTPLTTLPNVTTLGTITNVVHVDDHSGSLTVDNNGTFAVQNAPVVPTTILNGNVTVATAGTRTTLAGSTTCKSVTVKALYTNTGLIFVGSSTVAAANGLQLLAGESCSLDIANLNTVNIDSTVNGEGVTYLAVN